MIALERFLAWAHQNEHIRGLMLTGSLANQSAAKDHLSDYDIAVFGKKFDFIGSDDWLNEFQEFWICLHDQFDFLGYEIPTRLVIFNDRLKIDFSFYPPEILKKIIGTHELPDDFNIGYRILLDKDEMLNKLPKPTNEGFVVRRPSNAEYAHNVEEFWFEIAHIAKYLIRNDLWTVKFRDWSAKGLLLQMLQWNSGAKMKWKISPKPNGKEMIKWVDAKAWERLHDCFSAFDPGSSWVALEKTIQLYREIARETAALLNYTYNEILDSNLSAYIAGIVKSEE